VQRSIGVRWPKGTVGRSEENTPSEPIRIIASSLATRCSPLGAILTTAGLKVDLTERHSIPQGGQKDFARGNCTVFACSPLTTYCNVSKSEDQ
jgi:hypothetical protein